MAVVDVFVPSVAALADGSDTTFVTEGVDFLVGNDPSVIVGTVTVPSLDAYDELLVRVRVGGPGGYPPLHVTGTDADGDIVFEADVGLGRSSQGPILTDYVAPVYAPGPHATPITVSLSWPPAIAGTGMRIYDWWVDAPCIPNVTRMDSIGPVTFLEPDYAPYPTGMAYIVGDPFPVWATGNLGGYSVGYGTKAANDGLTPEVDLAMSGLQTPDDIQDSATISKITCYARVRVGSVESADLLPVVPILFGIQTSQLLYGPDYGDHVYVPNDGAEYLVSYTVRAPFLYATAQEVKNGVAGLYATVSVAGFTPDDPYPSQRWLRVDEQWIEVSHGCLDDVVVPPDVTARRPFVRLFPRDDKYMGSPRIHPMPSSQQTPGRITGYQ